MTLVKAGFAVVATAVLVSLGIQHPAAVYIAAFPAAAAVAWFAGYASSEGFARG